MQPVFEEFIKINHRLLWGYIYGVCGDRNLTFVILEKTLIRASRDKNKIANEKKPGPWLRKLARKILDKYKSKTIRLAAFHSEEAKDAYDECFNNIDAENMGDNPEQQLSSVKKIMRDLPVDLKDTYLRYYVQLDGPRGIAIGMGGTRELVFSHLIRIRKFLLKKINSGDDV